MGSGQGAMSSQSTLLSPLRAHRVQEGLNVGVAADVPVAVGVRVVVGVSVAVSVAVGVSVGVSVTVGVSVGVTVPVVVATKNPEQGEAGHNARTPKTTAAVSPALQFLDILCLLPKSLRGLSLAGVPQTGSAERGPEVSWTL